jgi:hypothetical protein
VSLRCVLHDAGNEIGKAKEVATGRKRNALLESLGIEEVIQVLEENPSTASLNLSGTLCRYRRIPRSFISHLEIRQLYWKGGRGSAGANSAATLVPRLSRSLRCSLHFSAHFVTNLHADTHLEGGAVSVAKSLQRNSSLTYLNLSRTAFRLQTLAISYEYQRIMSAMRRHGRC